MWLTSPPKVALAVAVPAFVLRRIVIVSDWLKPPAPVTVTVQGVFAEPA